MTVRLVEMRPTHVSAVAAIEARSNPAPWSEALLLAEFDLTPAARHWLVGLDAEQKVIGFGGVMFVDEDAHLMNLAVEPERRREGLARRLVRQLVTDSIAKGATNLTLEVRASNVGAIALYQEMGFGQSGLRPSYYDDGEDAVIMWHHDLKAV